MNDNIFQLYPVPSREVSLHGLYLDHDLRAQAEGLERVFVCANFIGSLDGRIAVPNPSGKGVTLAEAITNPRDWRLFQELAVQADIMITSGRYLREYATGVKQEILQIHNEPKFKDLQHWRLSRGFSPQPDLAVISSRLNFDVPPALLEGDRSLLVFTSQSADPDQIQRLTAQGAKVLFSGEKSVDGQELCAHMTRLGYQTVYSGAGPKVLHLLASSGILDRLYLTFANRLLGGEPYSSILEGPLLDPPIDMELNTLYFDPHGIDGLGQLFASYDRVE
ncbi:MAG: dihydrofolate reductase family protein [Anaerolineales bacterium]|nr:dihydrofolate reductase family protein [Anaerolineales bacterium]